MRYNIGFYCKSVPFNSANIRLDESLGGSESALIGIARELANQGHDISVFSDIPNPEDRRKHDGVLWRDLSDLPMVCRSVEWDIFISLRFPEAMNLPVRAKYRALWCQDILIQPPEFFSALWQVDEIYYVSEWQRRQYEANLRPEAKPLGYVTRNGVDLQATQHSWRASKNKDRLIYISRPERGIKPLIQIFGKMQKRRPDLELRICRYISMYEPNPAVAAICEEADELVASADGVEYLGNLNKKDLYREIAESALMLYPGVPDFSETSCIAAIEAQACRTPLICSNLGGLRETLHPEAGRHIRGDAYTEEYQESFIGAAFDLLDDAREYKKCQDTGFAYVRDWYQYDRIAREWSDHWDKYFADRFHNNPRAVIRNLVQHDDLVAALKAAEGFPEKPGVDLTDEVAEIKGLINKKAEPEEFAEHALPPDDELSNPRFESALKMAEDLAPAHILDFACGNGSMTGLLARQFPDAEIVGIDSSPDLCDIAAKFLMKNGLPVEIRCGSMDAIEPDEFFDLIFCGEYLEHQKDPQPFIKAMEASLTKDGVIIWTVPSGPLVEYLITPKMRDHRIHWEQSTLHEVFGCKPEWIYGYVALGMSPRGSPTGHWIIRHKAGPTGEIDWDKKIKTTRPYQNLSIMINTLDNENDLGRCLKSVRWIADEIIVCDNGSRDGTKNIAKAWGCQVFDLPPKWPGAPAWAPKPGSFEWIRNEALDRCTGDWVLWIDSDEELIDPEGLRRYLGSRVFSGYVVRQNHMIIDAPSRHDDPIRLFRNDKGFRFFGHIHEHCQASLNEAIEPAMELPDTQIIHFAYVTERARRDRCENRNMQLLALDRRHHPDRDLGKVLLAREYMNMTNWQVQEHGTMTPDAIKFTEAIIGIYMEDFADGKHRLHKLIFPIYQLALGRLGRGRGYVCDVRPAVAADENVLRFQHPDEFAAYMAKVTAETMAAGNMPIQNVDLPSTPGGTEYLGKPTAATDETEPISYDWDPPSSIPAIISPIDQDIHPTIEGNR